MKAKRIRIATAVTAVVAAMSLASPAPAADGCGKFTETCQKVENLVCYLTHRCL